MTASEMLAQDNRRLGLTGGAVSRREESRLIAHGWRTSALAAASHGRVVSAR